jgi:hypothetical protein
MRRMLLSVGLWAGLVTLIGCGQTTTAPTGKDGPVAKAEPKADAKHSGWWCDEHGVPEGECSMCSGKVAKECKAKGDWCDKHDRAKSQCFICDPTLMPKFAARYEAKYGKAPPEPEDNMPEKKDDKSGKK